jgi:outer membrane protein OmpA-like peptidoglycan-associated protein
MDPGAQTGDEPHGGATPGHTMKKVTERKLARRPGGSRLGWSFVLVPALVAAGAGFLGGPQIERDLESEVRTALLAKGLKGVGLQADGVFVTAEVPTSVDAAEVRDVVSGVDGVAAVTVERVFASKKEERACTNLDAKLNRATNQQRIPFVGRTDRLTPAGESMVRDAAKLVAACGSARVFVGGHTDDGTFDGPTLTLRRARVMIKVMRKAGAPEVRLVPRGYGAQYPIDPADNAAARARNERGSIALEGE